MKTLPVDVIAYKRTPEFTVNTVPVGLLNSHNTKAGVWGKIVVLEGEVRYRILEPEFEEVRLDVHTYGVVEPTVRHEVALSPDARFYVEFHRAAPAHPALTNPS